MTVERRTARRGTPQEATERLKLRRAVILPTSAAIDEPAAGQPWHEEPRPNLTERRERQGFKASQGNTGLDAKRAEPTANGRSSHRPLLAAAAVASAVLVALPLALSRDDTDVDYEASGHDTALPGNPSPHLTLDVPLPRATQESTSGSGQADATPAPKASSAPTQAPTSRKHQGPSSRAPHPTTSTPSSREDAQTPPKRNSRIHSPLDATATSAGQGSESSAVIRDQAATVRHDSPSKPNQRTANPNGARVAPIDHEASATQDGVTVPGATYLTARSGISRSGNPTAKATQTREPTRAGTQAPDAQRDTVVQATRVLEIGQSIASERSVLAMREDGNLVITDENGTVRWSSHTEGKGYKAVFQDDGHLVVYTRDEQTAWSSGTAGHAGAELVLQGDGDVVIRQEGTALWISGTAH